MKLQVMEVSMRRGKSKVIRVYLWIGNMQDSPVDLPHLSDHQCLLSLSPTPRGYENQDGIHQPGSRAPAGKTPGLSTHWAILLVPAASIPLSHLLLRLVNAFLIFSTSLGLTYSVRCLFYPFKAVCSS